MKKWSLVGLFFLLCVKKWMMCQKIYWGSAHLVFNLDDEIMLKKIEILEEVATKNS